MLPAGGDGVVEVCVGLLPRLVNAPGRVRLAEEEALRADPLVRLDAGPAVRGLRRICTWCAIPVRELPDMITASKGGVGSLKSRRSMGGCVHSIV